MVQNRWLVEGGERERVVVVEWGMSEAQGHRRLWPGPQRTSSGCAPDSVRLWSSRGHSCLAASCKRRVNFGDTIVILSWFDALWSRQAPWWVISLPNSLSDCLPLEVRDKGKTLVSDRSPWVAGWRAVVDQSALDVRQGMRAFLPPTWMSSSQSRAVCKS